MQMSYATGLIKDNDTRDIESYSIIKRAIKALGEETGHLLIYDSNWWFKHSLESQSRNVQLWGAEIYFKNFQWRDKMQLAVSRTQSA